MQNLVINNVLLPHGGVFLCSFDDLRSLRLVNREIKETVDRLLVQVALRFRLIDPKTDQAEIARIAIVAIRQLTYFAERIRSQTSYSINHPVDIGTFLTKFIEFDPSGAVSRIDAREAYIDVGIFVLGGLEGYPGETTRSFLHSLLSYGADPNTPSIDPESTLVHILLESSNAFERNSLLELVSSCVNAGFIVSQKTLDLACGYSYLNVVAYLLKRFPLPGVLDRLLPKATANHLDGYNIFVYLLSKGANADERALFPISFPPWQDDLTHATKIIKILVNRGVDLNRYDLRSGLTPLYNAMENNAWNIAVVLHQQGASLDAPNRNEEETPRALLQKRIHMPSIGDNTPVLLEWPRDEKVAPRYFWDVLYPIAPEPHVPRVESSQVNCSCSIL